MSELPENLKFKAEDFQAEWGNDALPSHYANRANALLSQRLGEVREVPLCFTEKGGFWVTTRGNTHRALLVCVKEVGE